MYKILHGLGDRLLQENSFLNPAIVGEQLSHM